MSADYMLMGVDDVADQDSPTPSLERSPTPKGRRLSQTRASAARKGSVTVACERCRRRKIRCSGLPGPCTSCAKFNIACLDPGKRKQRSSSFLEDRIRALEAIAATGAQLDPAAVHSLGSEFVNNSTGERTGPGPLHIQTANLANQAPYDDTAFLPMGGMTTDTWSYPATPAHSDMGPDVNGFWDSNTIPTTLPMDLEPDPGFTASLHRRAHTFPAVPTFNPATTSQDNYSLLSPVYSDLPSIQITSHDGSRSPSPSPNQMGSSAPLTLPFRDSFPPLEPTPQRATRTPPILQTDFATHDTNMDYYGDYLSPLDRPPVIPRRPSLSPSSPYANPNASQVSEWTSRVSSPAPSAGLNFNTAPKRRHTTCSIPRAQLNPTTKLLTPEFSWMLSSPRTRNYLTKYFTTIHNDYPFLQRHEFLSQDTHDPTSPFSSSSMTDSPLRIYTRLLTAAIGALLHDRSRDMSALYVRHEMTLAADSGVENGMFSSIQGIHAAMLLTMYLFLEAKGNYDVNKEDDDVSHPDVNLWLWSARVAMGCIDLGLHKWAGRDEADDEDGDLKHQNLTGTSRTNNVSGSYNRFEQDLSGLELQGAEEDEYGDNDEGRDDTYQIYDQANGPQQGVSVLQNPNALSPSPPHDDEDGQLISLYTNTFRSAFLLDRRISHLRRRPTAFHVGDIDGRLLEGLV